MCEQSDVCTIDHVKEICNHHLNAKPSNDSEVVSNLSSMILGHLDLSLVCCAYSYVQSNSGCISSWQILSLSFKKCFQIFEIVF